MNKRIVNSFVILTLIAASVGCNSANASGKVFPNPESDAPLATAKVQQTVVFSGGCFWGIQEVFKHVKGVVRATAGYSGGEAATANYDTVSDGQSGHAESVEVVFDASQVTVGQLLKVFFSVAHDPTQLNRQGPDSGTQYRSIIFFTNDEQQRVAKAYIEQLDKAKYFDHAIVTEVRPLKKFYRAEEYHQNYAVNHPYELYIVVNDAPKVENLKKKLPELYVK